MRAALPLPALVLLVLASCGGGGGDGGSNDPPDTPPDLTGWWVESADAVGAEGELLPGRLVELADDGAHVVYDDYPLVKDGWRFGLDHPSATAPLRFSWSFDILDQDHVDGSYEMFADGAVRLHQQRRLVRTTAPAGTLTIDGTVEGSDVDVDATRAYACELADAPWTWLRLADPDQHVLTRILLAYEAAPHIPVGVHSVGAGAGDIAFQIDIGLDSGSGASGLVTLTHSSADRVEGWYDVRLDTGETVTGAFDVPIRITTTWRE